MSQGAMGVLRGVLREVLAGPADAAVHARDCSTVARSTQAGTRCTAPPPPPLAGVMRTVTSSMALSRFMSRPACDAGDRPVGGL